MKKNNRQCVELSNVDVGQQLREHVSRALAQIRYRFDPV